MRNARRYRLCHFQSHFKRCPSAPTRVHAGSDGYFCLNQLYTFSVAATASEVVRPNLDFLVIFQSLLFRLSQFECGEADEFVAKLSMSILALSECQTARPTHYDKLFIREDFIGCLSLGGSLPNHYRVMQTPTTCRHSDLANVFYAVFLPSPSLYLFKA
jgi:hypothetical protein